MPEGESAAQQAIGGVTPKLTDLTDQVLFGDVWEGDGLSARDRSLVTALIALYCTDPARVSPQASSGERAEGELSETFTHPAFYSGWPNAMGAAGRLKALLADAAQPIRPTPPPASFLRPAQNQKETSSP